MPKAEIILGLIKRVQAGELTAERLEAILENLGKNQSYLGVVRDGVMECKPSKREAQNATFPHAKVKYNFGDGFKQDHHPPRRGIKPAWSWVRMQDYGV